MHLTGVPLQTLIQVGALAGAAVVVFYILKLRRRPVAVPFSKIWQRILRDKEATSLFSRLSPMGTCELRPLLAEKTATHPWCSVPTDHRCFNRNRKLLPHMRLPRKIIQARGTQRRLKLPFFLL